MWGLWEYLEEGNCAWPPLEVKKYVIIFNVKIFMLIVNTFENIHLKCIPPFRFLNTPMARLIRTSTVDLSMLTNEHVCYYFYILKNRNFDNFSTSVNWVTTADGCVNRWHDATQLLSANLFRLVETVANGCEFCTHRRRDWTRQHDSWVASASPVCTVLGFRNNC